MGDASQDQPNRPDLVGRMVSTLEGIVYWVERSQPKGGESHSARRAGVKRADARNYVFLLLLSFAVTVAATRYFLELTGYPQIATEELHIAHVLWGGLLLFIACAFMLALANRWVYPLAAILAGAGVGLFIDEVGKFLTQSNDYFYPFAAPLIYLLFIVTLQLYVRLRRPADPSPRSVMYRVLERLTEIHDSDFEVQEKEVLEADLSRVQTQTDDLNLQLMAGHLRDLLASPDLSVIPTRQTRWRRLVGWWERLHSERQGRTYFLALLAAGLIFLAWRPAVRLALLAQGLAAGQPVAAIGQAFPAPSSFSPAVSAELLLALVGLEGVIGVLLVVACLLLLGRRESQGLRVCRSSLWAYVGLLNIPLFYVNQFAALGFTIVQFALLWLSGQVRAHHVPHLGPSIGAA